MAGTASGGARRSRLAPYLLVAPGMLWLLVFFVVPTITLAQTSLSGAEGGWVAYHKALTNYGVHFFRSFRYALAATLIALALGYPLAYFIAFRAGKLKNLLLGLVILPFFTTFLVRTFAWKTILNDGGPAVWLLQHLHVLGEGGRLLDTTVAVVGGLTYNFLPFMILPIYVSLEKIDRRLVDAAEDLYSTPWPPSARWCCRSRCRASSRGACSPSSRRSATSSTPSSLGSPNQQMIGTVIQNQFLEVRDYPLAASLSFVLMAVITIGVLAYARALGTEDLA